MPFGEFQNHVCFSMFLVILLLITALFIIVIPKGTGACGEFQILAFSISSFLKLGNFRLIVSLIRYFLFLEVPGLFQFCPTGRVPFEEFQIHFLV